MMQTVKKLKKALSLVLMSMTLVCLSATKVEAAQTGSFPCSDGEVTWNLSDSGEMTISGSGIVDFTDSEYKSMHDYWSTISENSISDNTISITISSNDVGGIKLTGYDAESMFEGFTNLKSVYGFNYFGLENVTTLANAFNGCKSLEFISEDDSKPEKSIVLSISSNSIDCAYMFNDCEKLNNVVVQLSNPTNISNMFANTSVVNAALIIDNAKNLDNISNVFDNCSNLETVEFNGDFDLSSLDNSDLFGSNCTSLREIKFDNKTKVNNFILPKYLLENVENNVWVKDSEQMVANSISENGIYQATIPYVNFNFVDYNNGETVETKLYLNEKTSDWTEVLEKPAKDGYTLEGYYADDQFTTPVEDFDFDGTKVKQNTLFTYEDTEYMNQYNVYLKWICNHEDVVIKNAVEATCCEDGYSGDTYCNTCNEIISEGIDTKPTGEHDVKIVDEVEATCITEGHTGKTYCNNSDKCLDEGKVIPVDKDNHKHLTSYATEATCTEDGYISGSYCSDCKTELTEGTVVKAKGHQYESKITKEPTETSKGIKTYTCTRCKHSYIEELPIKLCMHTKTVVKNKKDATCCTKGYTGDVYCSVCNKIITKGKEIAYTNVHHWKLMSSVAATTKKEGSKVYKCVDCGMVKTEKIAKLEDTTSKKQISNAKKTKASISKITNTKGKKAVIKLKKKSGYKYQIKVATNKKFTKNVKTYKTSKTSYTVKNLKKNKTYYIKVRTYKKINGKTYYGKWSTIKVVKIKK